jgi:Leucine-rich repeat (LRR) protein
MSGKLSSSLEYLTNLEVLNLSGNEISGPIPAALSRLQNLERVDLSDNRLTGSIPSLFNSRGTLKSLNLSGNQLSGSVPSTLSSLTQLQELYLSSNVLSGSIPADLGNLTQLQSLTLSNNQLYSPIPAELGNLTNLQLLNLSYNRLSGTIPSTMGSLKSLQSLFLHDNRLTGSIPPELGYISSLEVLNISENQLSGTIPPSLGGAKELLFLDLADNQLSGSIPSSIGGLTNLLVLDLSQNMLDSAIPDSLGNIVGLVSFDLSANKLNGYIPKSLANLTSVNSFDIAYNALKTTDSILRGFLELNEPEWEDTQTLAPTQVDAVANSGESVTISWLTIPYAADSGRYEVWSSSSSDGPYTLAGSTFNKLDSELTLTGLDAGAHYFVVKTTTYANVHNKNAIISDPTTETSIVVGPRSTTTTALAGGGAAATSSLGNGDPTRAGYATISVDSGAAPYATVVFRYKQKGITVSQAAVSSSALTTAATFLVDYRAAAAIPGSNGPVDIVTGFAAVNMGTGAADITAVLRDPDGQVITKGSGTIAKGSHIAKYINQLGEILAGFVMPTSFPSSTRFGTLDLTSSEPLSLMALRLTTNQRGDMLLTSTPIADKTVQPASSHLYLPQLVDGGGYATTVFLMNPTSSIVSGRMELYASDGSSLTVKQANGPSASSFPYSIPAEGAYVFQTDASPEVPKVGWVRVTPDAGSTVPVGGGLFQYSQNGVLLTESGISSATPTTHARIYIEMSDTRNTGLALVNPGAGSAQINLSIFNMDGSAQAGVSQNALTVTPNGQFVGFVTQQAAGLPSSFRGVLDLASESPFIAMTALSLVNERGDFLLTAFPVADMNRAAPSPVVIPQIADGGGFTSEFILISAGPSSVATISFIGDDGNPLTLILNR